MGSYAIIVAVEQYSDKSIPRVSYAENDARAVDAALAALGFTTTVLLSAVATKATIESAVRKRARSLTADDTIYVFYAGHGFSKDDANYLTCHDTQRGDLIHTSLDLKAAVFDVLRKSKSPRVVLFLDACQSGMPADPNARDVISSLNDDELEEFFRDSEFYVCFSSCKMDETSYSHSSLQHGIWTHHLVEALNGRAKLAISNGIVTSSLLQDYLAKEVPLSVKTLRKKPDVQTPWACGAMSKQFVISDLRAVISARKAQKLAAAKQVNQAVLTGTKTQRVKSLSGFQRGHHEPDAVTNTTVSWVQKIAEDDLRNHLNTIHKALRENLGYGRTDVRVLPNGFVTPAFEYHVTLGLDPDDPREAVWRHAVSKMDDKDVILSDGFAKTFRRFLNTVEYEFPDPPFEVTDLIDAVEALKSPDLTVDYEADAEECDLYIADFPGAIHVTPESIIVTREQTTPRQLLEALPAVQKMLADKKKLPLLPF